MENMIRRELNLPLRIYYYTKYLFDTHEYIGVGPLMVKDGNPINYEIK